MIGSKYVGLELLGAMLVEMGKVVVSEGGSDVVRILNRPDNLGRRKSTIAKHCEVVVVVVGGGGG